jgi:transcriptional regulator with XRE-family HTH domain
VRKVSGAASYLAALGQAVRRHREDLGLSQEKFAFEVELDRTYVSGIERGVRNPTVATLLRLTKTLGLTPSTLLKAAERNQK